MSNRVLRLGLIEQHEKIIDVEGTSNQSSQLKFAVEMIDLIQSLGFKQYGTIPIGLFSPLWPFDYRHKMYADSLKSGVRSTLTPMSSLIEYD